jgi:hypothetical protein
MNHKSQAVGGSVPSDLIGSSKPILYGLPCMRCRAYYDVNLSACPVCGCGDRVAPPGGRGDECPLHYERT